MNEAEKEIVSGLARDLMRMASPWTQRLSDINSAILCGANSGFDQGMDCLRDLLADTTSAKRIVFAHGLTSWPGSFGQSPYEDALGVVSDVLAGHGHRKGANKYARAWHEWCSQRFAPAAALRRQGLSHDTVQESYPLLLESMRQAALLTGTEAQAALLHLLRCHPADRERLFPPCEAVAHFGGSLRVVRRAVEWRRSQRAVKSLAGNADAVTA